MEKITRWDEHIWFLLTAIFLEGMISYSTYEIFPDMAGKIVLVSLATIGLAFLIHRMSDEAETQLRQRGLLLLGFLNVALFANALMHASFGRELSGSKQTSVEVETIKDRELEREKTRAQIAQGNANANAVQLEAARKTLLQVQPSKAGALVNRVQGAIIQQREAPATAQPQEPSKIHIESPAEVRARLTPWLFWGLFGSLGIAVLGTTYLFSYKKWDGNGNGVADWLERAAENLGEDEFKTLYPKEYGIHKPKIFPGKQQQQSPQIGFQPAMAQADEPPPKSPRR